MPELLPPLGALRRAVISGNEVLPGGRKSATMTLVSSRKPPWARLMACIILFGAACTVAGSFCQCQDGNGSLEQQVKGRLLASWP